MAQIDVTFLFSAFDPRQFPAATFPEVAFAGRSNVGKSSLLNALTGQRQLARVSSTPGRTRAVNFFTVEGRCLFADLPGYGFAKVPVALKQEWRRLIEGYLAQRDSIAGVILLVDCRHPPQESDLQLASFLNESQIPYLLVATKQDKLSRNQLAASRKALAEGYGQDAEDILFVSSVSGEGIDLLWDQIDAAVAQATKRLKDEGVWGIPSVKAPKLGPKPPTKKEREPTAKAAPARGRRGKGQEPEPRPVGEVEAEDTRPAPLTPLHPGFYAPENKDRRKKTRAKAREELKPAKKRRRR